MEMNSKLFDDLTASYKVEKQKWVQDCVKVNMKHNYYYFTVVWYETGSFKSDQTELVASSGHYIQEWSHVVGEQELNEIIFEIQIT